jgi:sugar phosphate isomerase/epimerase
MRLAFSTLACPDWTLRQAVEAGIRYAYEGIELRIVDGELVTPSMGRAQRRQVTRTIGRAGLTLCCLDTSFEIGSPHASIDEGFAYVELAADLGAPLLRLFGGAPDGEPRNVTAGRVGERASALAERGRRVGVTIGVETHDSFAEGAVLAEVLGGAPADVGIIWDTLNPIVAGESPDRTLAAVGDRLVHVHIKDGAALPDPEENRLLGDGRVPVGAIVSHLVARGYEGWLSVEWEKRWQPSIAEPDVALPHYAAGIRGILDTVGRS